MDVFDEEEGLEAAGHLEVEGGGGGGRRDLRGNMGRQEKYA